MCTPCSPGVAFCTSTRTTTPDPPGVTRAMPDTLLLLRGSSLAVSTDGVVPGIPASGAPIAPASPYIPPASKAPNMPASDETVPASAPPAVPPDGAVVDVVVAQPQARIRSSVAYRMSTSGNGAPNLAGPAPLSTRSAHEREPGRRAGMLSTHHRMVRLLQRPRDGRSTAGADGTKVDLPHPDHLRRGPGHEDLVGDVELVAGDRLLDNFVAQIARQRHDR